MTSFTLKRTSLLMMLCFAGMALSACHPNAIGYNGLLPTGAINAYGYNPASTPSSSTSDDSANVPTFVTTTDLSVIQPIKKDTILLSCQNLANCDNPPYFKLLDATKEKDIVSNFQASLNAANTELAAYYNDKATQSPGATLKHASHSFYFGTHGVLNANNKDLVFDARSASSFDVNHPNQIPYDLKRVYLFIAGDIENAKSISLGNNIVTRFYNITVGAKTTTVTDSGNLEGNAHFQGDLVNNGKLQVMGKIDLKKNVLLLAQEELGHIAPEANYVAIDNNGALAINPIYITVDGNFTQGSSGVLNTDFGTVWVKGNASVNGTVKYHFPKAQNPNQPLAEMILASEKPIKVDKDATAIVGSNSLISLSTSFGFKYRVVNLEAPKVVKFQLGAQQNPSTFYALVANTAGAPVGTVTKEDFLRTNRRSAITLPCRDACSKGSKTIQDTDTKTGEALQNALPKTAQPTTPSGISYWGNKATVNVVFTSAIQGPSTDVDFKSIKAGVAAAAFSNEVTLKSLTLNPNTLLFLNGVSLTGNLTLKNTHEKATGNTPNTDVSDAPILVAMGTVNGNLNNQNGFISVIQKTGQEVDTTATQDEITYALHPGRDFGLIDTYFLNIAIPDLGKDAIRTLSFPVGLVVNGDYTQTGSGNIKEPNLSLTSGILFVNGQIDIKSGAITYGYKPTPGVSYHNLLMVSTKPIKVEENVTFFHMEKEPTIDTKGLNVELSEGLYGWVNLLQTDSTHTRSVPVTVHTQAINRTLAHFPLLQALSEVKASVVTVPVVDGEGNATGETLRIAAATPLTLLRDQLMSVTPEVPSNTPPQAVDMLEGNPIVRLQQATLATQLYLDNSNLFGLFDEVHAKPAAGSALRLKVGVANDVLFGGKQHLANSTQVYGSVATGMVTARLSLNYVGLRQNTTSRDHVDTDELSLSKAYGINLGAQWQLPSLAGVRLGADLGFEHFNNTLMLSNRTYPDEAAPSKQTMRVKFNPTFSSATLSATLVGSKTLSLAALHAKNDVLNVAPFVGYRFVRQENEQFQTKVDLNTIKLSLTAQKQSQLSNSLIMGASVQYQNAFGVQGLQLGAQLLADVALNSGHSHKMSFSIFNRQFQTEINGKGNNTFTAQGLLSAAYQLNNVQLGARAQLQINHVMQGSVGGFANFSF